MHHTTAARKFVTKDSEVVLLFNPAASQVFEVYEGGYEPSELLTAKCFPKAHPWPREYFWLILGFGGGSGSRSQRLAALSQLFAGLALARAQTQYYCNLATSCDIVGGMNHTLQEC